MKGQVIKKLYRSSEYTNWALLETDIATFELRLGGLNPTKEKRANEFEMHLPVIGKKIKKVMTDDYDLYIELENGECLIHSDNWIDGKGNLDFEIRLVSKPDFIVERKQWYDSDRGLKEVK